MVTSGTEPPEGARPGATGRTGGSDTRVVDVQRQTVPMLLVALGFALAAPVAAIVPHRTGSWLPLHLFLVGGLLSAIVGGTQMLAVTWSAAPAPVVGLARLQRYLMVPGVIAVAAGREAEVDPFVVAGGAAVTVVVLSLVLSLLRIRGAATTDRFQPAIDGYLMACGWALVGVVVGTLLAVDPTISWWARLREAHVVVNVFGFVGLVVAATLPYFVATQARMKMSRRATPRRLRAVLVGMAGAVALTASGQLTERPLLAAAGYLAYAVGLVATVAHLPAVRRRQLRWAGPRLVQLGAGIVWWVAVCVALAGSELGDSVDRSAALRVLVVGGFAQILVASLAYLGPVLRGGGHHGLTAGFATTRSWVSLLAANAAALSLAIGVEAAAGVAVAVWVADTVVRATILLLPTGP